MVGELSVDRDKGVAVGTVPACPNRHADKDRGRRQTETRTYLNNQFDLIEHLRFDWIYLPFI